MWRVLVIVALLSTNLFGQAAEGNDQFLQGHYAEAVAAYQNVPQAERNAGLFNRVGVSYHFLNRLKDAEASYLAAVRMDRGFSDAINNLAALYYSQLKFRDAERQFR